MKKYAVVYYSAAFSALMLATLFAVLRYFVGSSVIYSVYSGAATILILAAYDIGKIKGKDETVKRASQTVVNILLTQNYLSSARQEDIQESHEKEGEVRWRPLA